MDPLEPMRKSPHPPRRSSQPAQNAQQRHQQASSRRSSLPQQSSSSSSPPRRSSVQENPQQQQQQQQQQQKPLERPIMHVRNASSGSVRGAFYQGTLAPPASIVARASHSPPRHHHHHSSSDQDQHGASTKRKKKSPKGDRRASVSKEKPIDLADMAALAINTLEVTASKAAPRLGDAEAPAQPQPQPPVSSVPSRRGSRRPPPPPPPPTTSGGTHLATGSAPAMMEQQQQNRDWNMGGLGPHTTSSSSSSSMPLRMPWLQESSTPGGLATIPDREDSLSFQSPNNTPKYTHASPATRTPGPDSFRYSDESLLGSFYFDSGAGGPRRESQLGNASLVGSAIVDQQFPESDPSQSNSASMNQPRNNHPLYKQNHPLHQPSQAVMSEPSPEVAMFSAMAQADFSAMAQADYGAVAEEPKPAATTGRVISGGSTDVSDYDEADDVFTDEDDEEDDEDDDESEDQRNLVDRLLSCLDPTDWLIQDAEMDEEGNLQFNEKDAYTMAGFVRHFLWNPINPEFSSLQQFNWAVILGVVMGFFTAVWKFFIESGIEVIWETVPTFLYKVGFFTDLDGIFPMYHYMWLCPAICGGLLAYIFVILPDKIPDQNEWINNVHTRGVLDHRTFWTLFVLSTMGMWSGLSLGPELPLVLTAGMAGSWLGKACKQSMLQARVMNLTAAGAAVGGFFGFPMAGAMFVLEIPHRMGLQYFEAVSPATIGSIVAVLSNRMITGNEVTGYYSYPFLTSTLPSEIFTNSIVYGLFGAAVGIAYAKGAMKLKTMTHDLFHAHHDDDHHDHAEETHEAAENGQGEESPLIKKSETAEKVPPKAEPSFVQQLLAGGIKNEAHRMALVGTLAGAAVGVIGMFVPHTMFWGEAQLQNLIDKGRTPLPIFGEGDEPTAALVALGQCMIDPNDTEAVEAGFSLGCSALISVAKVVVIGLSLGTGIIGGHFWGPLFVGCSASHFLADVVNIFADNFFGIGRVLADYPCLIILCTMGSAHVVTFRAHIAIMLILTLTISAFDPEEGVNSSFKVAGDYSAVFPLLVVSVFVALMVSRDTVFYKTQRSRGDIMAVPEVLCEPGMEGRPMVVDYDIHRNRYGNDNEGDDEYEDDDEYNANEGNKPGDDGHAQSDDSDAFLVTSDGDEAPQVRKVEEKITQGDIERDFLAKQGQSDSPHDASLTVAKSADSLPSQGSALDSTPEKRESTLAGLDDLLSRPTHGLIKNERFARRHRRTQSAPMQPGFPTHAPRGMPSKQETIGEEPAVVTVAVGMRERTNSGGSRSREVRVTSYGELHDHQPSLLDQARQRSASSAAESRHRRVPSLPSGRRHRKTATDTTGALSATIFSRSSTPPPHPPVSTSASVFAQAMTPQAPSNSSHAGALSLDDIDQALNSVLHQGRGVSGPFSGMVWTSDMPEKKDGRI